MAIYDKSTNLLRLLGQNLYSKPGSLTLADYVKVGSAYPGLTIVNYLLSNGVPETLTFKQLIYSRNYFNIIDRSLSNLTIVDRVKNDDTVVTIWGQDSGADIPQNELSVDPQNAFMGYKPTNQTMDDFYNYKGAIQYVPLIWTDPNGITRYFELRYISTVLADGTLIFDAYDINYDVWYWVAMRRSAHNHKNLEFVDALIRTEQFTNVGYDYTIKNSENSVTFLWYAWGETSGDVVSKTTTLNINTKGKLSAVDNAIKMSFTGLLGLYNELTGESYINFSVGTTVYPITTFNDDFNQLMNGSKLGTFYFLISQVDDGNGGGLVNVNTYENIIAVNFLTGTYELINATAKLQEVINYGNFPNVDPNKSFVEVSSHPEGLLFSLSDGIPRDNYSLQGVTRIWSPEWTNYLNPTPLTTRYLDDNLSNNGTYSSYGGNIFSDYSNDTWNLSPKHLYTFYNTISGYGSPFGPIGGQNINHIYRFELNPETYNNEPELQSIAKSTGTKYPIVSFSSYGPGGEAPAYISIGKVTNSTYQFPTNSGIAFSNSSGFFNNGNYGSLELNYWNDSSMNPIAIGSNLGYPEYHTNDTVIQTSSSYYKSVYPVNVDKYKGVNFGL